MKYFNNVSIFPYYKHIPPLACLEFSEFVTSQQAIATRGTTSILNLEVKSLLG